MGLKEINNDYVSKLQILRDKYFKDLQEQKEVVSDAQRILSAEVDAQDSIRSKFNKVCELIELIKKKGLTRIPENSLSFVRVKERGNILNSSRKSTKG